MYEFWKRQQLTMFDVSIVDTDTETHITRDSKILLGQWEEANFTHIFGEWINQ